MPRRSILSAAEREGLLELPASTEDLIRNYTFSDTDLALINERRRPSNRLGLAVQLCHMRYPGMLLAVDAEPDRSLLRWVADQVGVPIKAWREYAQRAETRREHSLELQSAFGYQTFTKAHRRASVASLADLADRTDKGIVLARAVVARLCSDKVLLPSTAVIELICAEALTLADRRLYAALTEPLSREHRKHLDGLLERRSESSLTWLAWLRLSPAKPNSRHMLEHIERLRAWQQLGLPTGIDRQVRRVGQTNQRQGASVRVDRTSAAQSARSWHRPVCRNRNCPALGHLCRQRC